jgi:NADH:ubiquinone oxidoreductase subunit 6 (subunit J)
LFVLLVDGSFRTQWAIGGGRPPAPTTKEIGRLFLGQYLLPFEAASILLLVALMGAAMIVRRRKDA